MSKQTDYTKPAGNSKGYKNVKLPSTKKDGIRILIVLIVTVIFSGVCFYVASLTQCQGVGLGGLDCNGGLGLSGALILDALAAAGPLIVAPLLMKAFDVGHPIRNGLFVGVVPLLLAWPAFAVQNKFRQFQTRSDLKASSYQTIQKLDFQIYMPSNLPSSTLTNVTVPNTGSAEVDTLYVDYNGFSLVEDKMPQTGCFETPPQDRQGCQLVLTTNTGLKLYVHPGDTDPGGFTKVGNTYITLIGSSKSEEIMILDSLKPVSKSDVEAQENQILNQHQ